MLTYCLFSSGRRNTTMNWSEHTVERLGGRSPSERLAGSAVQSRRHGGKLLDVVDAQVRPLWEVLPQEPVGVLVRAPLPGRVRIAKVDLQACIDPQPCVLRHLGPLVPCQRASHLLG